MNEKEKLRQKLGELDTEVKDIEKKAKDEKRDFTDEENDKVDALLAQVETIQRDIEKLDEKEKRELRIKNAHTDISKNEKPAAGGADDITVKKDETEYNCFGELLLDIRDAGDPNRKNPERLFRYHDLHTREILGSSGTVPSEGGFLVGTDFLDALLTDIIETGQLASRCASVTVSKNSNGIKLNAVDEKSRATGSRFGGLQAYWLDEGAPITPSKPKFKKVGGSLKKIAALYYATEEELEDAQALGSFVQMAVSNELGFMLDDAILSGSGVGRPLGLTKSPAMVTVAKESAQSAKTIVYKNIQKMWMRLPARSKKTAIWLYNGDCFEQLSSLYMPTGADHGVPVFSPANNSTGKEMSLMGRPMVEIEQAETLGTKGDLSLVDLSQYLLIKKGGLKYETSIHVEFKTDQMAFRFILRINGIPLWSSPLIPFKGADTRSPYINLATRSA